MANFEKFLDKGNDALDRAEVKAKERQAMSENPEEEQQGITAKDMAGAGVETAKDMAKDKITEKAVDKFKDKYLNKDGDSVLNEGAEAGKDAAKDAGKDAEKSAADNMKDKYLNKNPNSDSLLNDSKSQNPKAKEATSNNKVNSGGSTGTQSGGGSQPAGGTSASTGGTQAGGGTSTGGTNSTPKSGGGNSSTNQGGKPAKKNAFGDSKNPNEKSATNFKKDPTAGANAAKAGSDMAKEGAKDAAKDVAKDAAKEGVSEAAKGSVAGGEAAGIAKNIAQGNIDGATDDAIALAAGKAAQAATGGVPVVDKAVSFVTKAALKTEGGKATKYCCGIGCLGIIGVILSLLMLIPMLISSINKMIADIVENIPIVGAFTDFIQDNLTEKLGIDFGDFDFEDIGQDSAKMEDYARFKERFMERNVDISYYNSGDKTHTTYHFDNGEQAKEPTSEPVSYDPEAMITDYLPIYRIFAALENVKKHELADQLKEYFLDGKERYHFEIVEDIAVHYEYWPVEVTKVNEETGETYTVIEEKRVTIKKRTPKLILTKATTLNEILYFEWEEVRDGENVTWQQTGQSYEVNTEVISLFNTVSWSKDEISTFEYIADTRHPLNTVYNVGVYGFTSVFTMPVDDYTIASEFGDTREPYSEENPNKGIDILAEQGTEAKAIADGTVEEVGDDYIKLRMGDDIIVTYSGLKERPSLSSGASVTKGQVIGYVGDNNLHFEVLNKDGKNINPQLFLASSVAGTNAQFLDGASMVFYHQGDQPSVGGVSIASAGCGPTSLAMVLSSPKLGSINTSPADVAARAQRAGMWGCGRTKGYNGADWTMFKTVAAQYGVTNLKQVDPLSNKEKIREALQNGYPVIFSISGVNVTGVHTKFTNNGHFIVADGFYDDGKVRILDPNYKAADGDHWANFDDNASKDGLFTGARQAWIFYGR